MLGLEVTLNLPILVYMNDGRWADCCTPNSSGGWGDSLLDFIASQPNTTVLSSTGTSDYDHNGGNNYFSLSRLNSVYRNYKKRNVQAAASTIAAWAASNPSLFVGVSLDSETFMPNKDADHNPLAIEEWKQWLQNIGIYGPGGEYFGTGRVPAFMDIPSFNSATGQNFASWDAMQPPGSVTPGDLLGEEWQRWRVMLVLHHVSDETAWIAQAGIDRNLIYGHQTPRSDDYGFADDVMTETAANGAGGVTFYGWDPANYGDIVSVTRASGKNNWGNFELNPQTTDQAKSYNNLVALHDAGIKVICPNSWESDEAVKASWTIFPMAQSLADYLRINTQYLARQTSEILSGTPSINSCRIRETPLEIPNQNHGIQVGKCTIVTTHSHPPHLPDSTIISRLQDQLGV